MTEASAGGREVAHKREAAAIEAGAIEAGAHAAHHHHHHHAHHHQPAVAEAGHQQHPLRLYFIVWFWLFVLSFCSYMVDLMDFQGLLRWTLVSTFMILKAGLIVAVFMHMVWERLALTTAILLPPIAVLVFVVIMAFEGDYTVSTREAFFLIGD